MTTAVARNPRFDALAVDFLMNRVGVERPAAARMIGADEHMLDTICAQQDAELTPRIIEALDRLIAIQSLLLSSYQPETAAKWLKTPNASLQGLSPINLLRRDGDKALEKILTAVHERIAA